MNWWTVPIVVLVTFTLYGIDGIAMQLEDPFGYDKNDIRMDAIVEDVREEIMVLLEEWERVGLEVAEGGRAEMFIGGGKARRGDRLRMVGRERARGQGKGGVVDDDDDDEVLVCRGVIIG